MSLLSSIFGGGDDDKSPMDAANQYLNQIPGVGHAGYDPYVKSGMEAGNRTQSEYEKLISDPTAFINQLMKGYQPSEGYQFQKGELTKDLSNTAASGGIAGTPFDRMNQGKEIQGLLSGDMQQFLANILGAYKTGITGEEGIAQRGFGASQNLTDLLGSSLNQQGGLAFQNEQQKNKDKNDLWSMFGQALGTGVGAVAGGVPGAAVGSQLFGGGS